MQALFAPVIENVKKWNLNQSYETSKNEHDWAPRKISECVASKQNTKTVRMRFS